MAGTQRDKPTCRRNLRRIMLALAAVFVCGPDPAIGQEYESQNFHTWTDLATIYRFSTQFRYDGDYGIRGALTDEDWTLYYLRPSVRYMPWSRVALHGGAAVFYNSFKDSPDLTELRPWIGVRITGPSPGGWVFTNYFRLEGRSFYSESSSSWDSALRGRWQLQLKTPAFFIGSARGFYALSSIEPLIDIGTTIEGSSVDRFRFNLGLGKRVTTPLRVELNYLFHKTGLRIDGERLDADDHILRLRFFYAFN